MKKIFMALCLCLVFLVGCGKSTQSSNDTTKAEGGNDEAVFAFSIDSVTIAPGENFGEAYEKLGEPVDYTEAASCYYDGMDKVYTYDGYEVRTYPDGDNDMVQDICISSDKYSTDKEITVGSTLEEITAAYGDDYSLSGKMYKYYVDDTRYMYFFIMDDAVKYFGYAIDAAN